MAAKRTFTFTYDDISRVTGMSPNVTQKHLGRGYVDPDDLESLLLYLARYGSQELKMRIIEQALRRDMPDDPGGWRARNKKATARRTAAAKRPTKKVARKRRAR